MRTILIVDDEENLRILVRTTLDGTDFRIIEAANGNETLDVVEREHPDLILLDWMMPGLSGIEVLMKLQEGPKTSAIPVIMLTAKAQKSDIELGLSLGARVYLTKPFSPLELIEKVNEVLGVGS